MAPDRSQPDARAQDPDTPDVVEALRGAEAGPHDPDVELAQMLPQLVKATNGAIIDALERLVRHASTDRD